MSCPLNRCVAERPPTDRPVSRHGAWASVRVYVSSDHHPNHPEQGDQLRKRRDPMLRELLNQLIQTNLALVQILTPTIELEYGADTADKLISALGEQLRSMLHQLEALQGPTTVRVIPGQVQLTPRHRA
jgi:hypothetical protein